jgi:hypothetical protein
MARERVQTRCDGDTADAIEQYGDDREISESEAVRRLLRIGLDAEGYDSPVSVGAENVKRLAEREGYATAEMSRLARTLGGALIGLAILAVLLASLGVI